jgi:hypothetical protein
MWINPTNLGIRNRDVPNLGVTRSWMPQLVQSSWMIKLTCDCQISDKLFSSCLLTDSACHARTEINSDKMFQACEFGTSFRQANASSQMRQTQRNANSSCCSHNPNSNVAFKVCRWHFCPTLWSKVDMLVGTVASKFRMQVLAQCVSAVASWSAFFLLAVAKTGHLRLLELKWTFQQINRKMTIKCQKLRTRIDV